MQAGFWVHFPHCHLTSLGLGFLVCKVGTEHLTGLLCEEQRAEGPPGLQKFWQLYDMAAPVLVSTTCFVLQMTELRHREVE